MQTQKAELVKELKGFMINELNLKRSPEEIKDGAPLFGPDGLGIDSLDGLQLGLAAEQRYGVKIDVDTDAGKSALASVESLADFILRAKGAAS